MINKNKITYCNIFVIVCDIGYIFYTIITWEILLFSSHYSIFFSYETDQTKKRTNPPTSLIMGAAKNSHYPWCLPLPWRRREARDTHGEVSPCRSHIRIFLWMKLRSERARIRWKDDRTRHACISRRISTYDPQVEMYEEIENAFWVWYCDFLWQLPRRPQACTKRCKKNILLSYSTEILIWFSGPISFQDSVFYSSHFSCYFCSSCSNL